MNPPETTEQKRERLRKEFPIVHSTSSSTAHNAWCLCGWRGRASDTFFDSGQRCPRCERIIRHDV